MSKAGHHDIDGMAKPSALEADLAVGRLNAPTSRAGWPCAQNPAATPHIAFDGG
jgi:hypothetical protein